VNINKENINLRFNSQEKKKYHSLLEMNIKCHQHISLKPPYCLRVFISLCYFYVLPVRQWSEPIPFSKWYLCPQSISLIRLIMLFEFVSAPLSPKSFLCPLVFCFPKKISHCRSDFIWFANYPNDWDANKMIKNCYNYACLSFIVFRKGDCYYYDNHNCESSSL